MGNCLDRTLSDEAENEDTSETDSRQSRRTSSRHRSQNHYTRLAPSMSSSSSLSSLTDTQQRILGRESFISSQSQAIHADTNNNRSFMGGSSIGSFHTTNGSSLFTSSSLPSSLRCEPIAGSLGFSSSFNNNNNSAIPQQQQQQVFYLTPNVQRTADQLTVEEQIKLLKRMTLIQQLPTGSYDECKKNKECAICMIDFEVKDTIKYLPCMHTFHQSCIDSWLVRSLICPSCMEPVDAGLLSAYENE